MSHKWLLKKVFIIFILSSFQHCQDSSFSGKPGSQIDKGTNTSGGSSNANKKEKKEVSQQKGNPDLSTDATPSSERPGGAGFFACKSNTYTSDQVPIRVDAYHISDALRDASLKQPYTSCGGGSSCFEMLGAENSTKIYRPENKFAEFCMTHYDVAKRFFSQGFPKADGTDDKINVLEWFAFNSWVKLVVDEPGKYQFSFISDDGARLFIDGVEVVNNDGVHAVGTLDKNGNGEGTKDLTKGEHPLQVLYFQGPRNFIALQLYWKTPSNHEWSIIPKEKFRFMGSAQP